MRVRTVAMERQFVQKNAAGLVLLDARLFDSFLLPAYPRLIDGAMTGVGRMTVSR
jgi:hypothetical protein